MILLNIIFFALVTYASSQQYKIIDSTKFHQPKSIFQIRQTEVKIAPRIFSTPEECARSCRVGEKFRYCYYHFTLEYYATMGRACEQCKPNSTNQLKNIPQCQCIEADGFERGMLSINRMLPGPSIQVCKNDMIIVDVHNKIQGMEVALHWHGMKQQGSQYYDGVPFLTQCPITSGTTFRYQFVAADPGTHFYHSHTGLQKIDGQYGSLIVRQPPDIDPHKKFYDEDLPAHVILLSDWMHEVSTERFPGRVKNKPGQEPDNVLINGKGRWMDKITKQTTSVQLESFVVESGKRYRFRLINSFSTVCQAQLIIEGHNLMLIAQDGEPVNPVFVNTIITSSGERADFVLHATQHIRAYWIKVQAIGACAESNITQSAILKYKGGPAIPKTSQFNNPKLLKLGKIYNDPTATTCNDRKPTANSVCANQLKYLDPIPKEMLKPHPDHQIILPFKFHSYNDSINELFKVGSYNHFLAVGNMNHVTSLIDNISFTFPGVPPLSQSISTSETCNKDNLPKNCGNPCHCPHTHDIKRNAIVEVVLYNEMSQTELHHPFHLHGHSFHIFKIGRVKGSGDIAMRHIQENINEHHRMLQYGSYVRPAKKDTIAVPDGGYVILRFKADNPGWWLFHCHFLYHTAIGMDVVLHVGERRDLPPVPLTFPTCHSFTPDIV